MKNTEIQQIQQYINRSVEKVDERAEEDKAKKRLNVILSAETADPETVEAVKAFMAASDVNRQKLYAFCANFVDPTYRDRYDRASRDVPLFGFDASPQVAYSISVSHTYLSEDEATKLKNFVKRHSCDGSFGETVFKIMEDHGMVPADVYKNVFMDRQAFSRVTTPGCKNVSRRMAWLIIIGLHCTLDEADAILFSAGYVRRNSALDLTMQYFVEHGNYDIFAINEVLALVKERPYNG